MWLQNVKCEGDEEMLGQCEHDEWGDRSEYICSREGFHAGVYCMTGTSLTSTAVAVLSLTLE